MSHELHHRWAGVTQAEGDGACGEAQRRKLQMRAYHRGADHSGWGKVCMQGDTVRIFSPTEQVHFLDYGQKETLPLDSLLDPSHPVISFLLGTGMNFIHLRTSRWSTDQKHSSLLISNFSSYKLLKGNNRWLLILCKIGGRADEMACCLKYGSHRPH